VTNSVDQPVAIRTSSADISVLYKAFIALANDLNKIYLFKGEESSEPVT
jgi:hypothetical protein